MFFFFSNWMGLARIVVIGPLVYVALILLLRISGKRTLTKLNAFDMVITIALGSTLATVLLSKDVALADGVVAFATLIALQFVVAWSSSRSKRILNLIKAEPTLLLHDGEFLDAAMRGQRIAREDLMAVLRNSGVTDPGEVKGIILETDGSFSVLSSGNVARVMPTVKRSDL